MLEPPEHQPSFPEQVAKRFRLVPNFFVSTPDAPEIVERLWTFAAAAYLDNPIPTLFKERLFVFLFIALYATPDFFWVMAMQRVTPRLTRRPLNR